MQKQEAGKKMARKGRCAWVSPRFLLFIPASLFTSGAPQWL